MNVQRWERDAQQTRERLARVGLLITPRRSTADRPDADAVAAAGRRAAVGTPVSEILLANREGTVCGPTPEDGEGPDDEDSYYADVVEVHRSARKHGVTDVDSVRAASEPVMVIDVEGSEPPKEVRVGFDTAGRLLETVVLLLDDDRVMVIHAMGARRRYVDELM